MLYFSTAAVGGNETTLGEECRDEGNIHGPVSHTNIYQDFKDQHIPRIQTLEKM